ncbi:MAG TPA: glucose-6-phosphate dehydrogenase assembly protein OpcA [Acidimicrobiales bacterium]|nr:glucose-6-phosphate dehydrogenase assembly protein OpcA [Acidimicrobiales bacterium]
MTVTLWDTTGGDVVKALAAERRAGAMMATGLALTLVVTVDEKNVAEAERAATVAAQAHPCRLVVVIRRQLDTANRLDAEVQVGGRLGPIEAVVMRMYGRLTLHPESVVLPLLAPDCPVVTWWHGAPPDEIATDPLGVLADRRVTDSSLAPDPMAALRQRASDFSPGDTDLAWTRTTPWRSLLASAFDALEPRPISAKVASEKGNPSAALLAGWLGKRLGVDAHVEESGGPGVTEAEVLLGDHGEDPASTCAIRLSRPDGRLATFSRSGQPDRQLPLLRRQLGDLLAEELRRLDPDAVYAESLEQATRLEGLSSRPTRRTHRWQDPAEQQTTS